MSPLTSKLELELMLRTRTFGFDNRVGQLNYELLVHEDFPEPHFLLKPLRRFITLPVKRCWLETWSVLSILARCICRRSQLSFRRGRIGTDIEHIGNENEGEAGSPWTIAENTLEKAKSDFRASLQKLVGKGECERIIVGLIAAWANVNS